MSRWRVKCWRSDVWLTWHVDVWMWSDGRLLPVVTHCFLSWDEALVYLRECGNVPRAG